MRRISQWKGTSARLRSGIGAFALLACFAVCAFSASWAADSSGDFRVFGSGKLSCLRWLDDRRLSNDSARQSEMWIAGYLTAYNQHVFKERDVSAKFDGAYIMEWIDGYCRKRGQNDLVIAAHELVQMLRRRQ